MAEIFEITEEIRGLARSAINDLINQLGRDCRLVYPPKVTECTTCVNNLAGKGNQTNYGIWRTGGPAPHSMNTGCPVCNGAGTITTEVTEVIKMLVSWDPKEFKIYDPEIRLPQGSILTKTFIYNLPKIKMCQEVIIEPTIEPYTHFRFKLAGEPIQPGNIVQGTFCVCFWARI